MKYATLRLIETTLLPAIVLALWQGAWSKGWLPRLFLPAPSEIWMSLTRMVQSGELLLAASMTGWRLLVGWLAASLLGIALGIAVGSSRIGHRLLSPTLEFIRPLPASALIPLLILAMGLTDQMIVAVIALGSLWPVMLGTVAGVRAVEPRLLEVAAGLEMSRLEVTTRIALPAALPDILAGLRLGLTLALVLCVVAEMISMSGGLGGQILLASRNFRAADLFAGIFAIGATGLVLDLCIGAVERRCLRWRRA
jgi:sulfonate transport system permease protein